MTRTSEKALVYPSFYELFLECAGPTETPRRLTGPAPKNSLTVDAFPSDRLDAETGQVDVVQFSI